MNTLDIECAAARSFVPLATYTVLRALQQVVPNIILETTVAVKLMKIKTQ